MQLFCAKQVFGLIQFLDKFERVNNNIYQRIYYIKY